jgi:hypothetical protein
MWRTNAARFEHFRHVEIKTKKWNVATIRRAASWDNSRSGRIKVSSIHPVPVESTA